MRRLRRGLNPSLQLRPPRRPAARSPSDTLCLGERALEEAARLEDVLSSSARTLGLWARPSLESALPRRQTPRRGRVSAVPNLRHWTRVVGRTMGALAAPIAAQGQADRSPRIQDIRNGCLRRRRREYARSERRRS